MTIYKLNLGKESKLGIFFFFFLWIYCPLAMASEEYFWGLGLVGNDKRRLKNKNFA